VGVVLVGSAGVEDDGVVQELDVAGLEVHLDVERGVVRDVLDEPHRGELLAGEAWHLSVALCVADVPADIEEPRATVDVRQDRQREVRVFAGCVFVVAVPVHRRVQDLERARVACEDLVVDGSRAGNAAPGGSAGTEPQHPSVGPARACPPSRAPPAPLTSLQSLATEDWRHPFGDRPCHHACLID
jgi:hypothetical protein